MDELIQFLNMISPIAQNTEQKIISFFRKKTVKKNERFTEMGEMSQKIAFLESGVMRAYYQNHEGKEYNKHFFTAPSFIGGYSSLISNKPNQIIQEALTNCVIWETNYANLTGLYEEHPDLERMARCLAEYFFVQKEQKEIEIVLLNADERYEIFQQQYPTLEQVIPQYHIASYLGITPTQLSRIRKELSQK